MLIRKKLNVHRLDETMRKNQLEGKATSILKLYPPPTRCVGTPHSWNSPYEKFHLMDWQITM